MKTPARWFSVARPFTGRHVLPSSRAHLGLGADHWPELAVDAALRQAVGDAMEYYPIPTLSGEEWCELMCDRPIAQRFYEAARSLDATVRLLSLSLSDAGGIGWDIGTPGGGHSIIPHEVSRTPIEQWPAVGLNASGLFESRDAAMAHWHRRSEGTGGRSLEEPGAWAVVHISVTPSGA